MVKKDPELFASAKRLFQRLFLDFFTEDVNTKSLSSLAFIIIDGLDETSKHERVKFPACLAELVQRSSTAEHCRIQVGIFARPDVSGDPGFEKVGFRTERTIMVTPARNTVDIETFVRNRFKDVSILNALRTRKAKKEYDALARQTYSSVLARSQGMILWASLVFDEICNSPSPEAIRRTLQEAPQGLDDMIHHVFKRLHLEEQTHYSYLSELLSCVYCAYRPLYISEMFVLLLSLSGQHYLSLKDELKAKYSSLFEISGSSDDLEQDDKTEVLDEEESDSVFDGFDFLNNPDPDEGDSAEEENGDEAFEDVDKNGLIHSGSQKQEDGFSTLPAHWSNTTMAFSHARIRDYLRTEGGQDPNRPRRWKDDNVVSNDLNTTTLLFAIALFRIMRSNLASQYEIESLETYANLNSIKKFAEVDFTKTSRDAAVQAARLLAGFFSDGDFLLKRTLRMTSEFIQTWFGTDRYSKLVRKIIGKQLADLDEKDRPWAE